MLFREIAKVIRQAQGKENIFGYRSTSVNQLYLLYCFSGKIFTTDKIHWQLRLLWLISNVVASTYSCIAFILDTLLGDEEYNFGTLLYVLFVISLTTFAALIVPLLTYRYSSNIERMILLADSFEINREHDCVSCQRHACPQNLLENHWVPLYFTFAVSMMVCILDVALFYEDYKVSSILYTLIPFPHGTGEVPSSWVFFIFNITFVVLSFTIFMSVFCILKFFIMWALICQQEIMKICDHINIKSNAFVERCEKSGYLWETQSKHTNTNMSMDRLFVCDLVSYIEAFQNVKKMIETIRGCFELFGLTVIPTTTLSLIPHFFLLLNTDLDIAVQCKEVAGFFCTAIAIFYIFHIGETIENLTRIISLEIYSTPWYLLEPKYRRDILQMLCQTQKLAGVKILNTYPINMNFCMIYMSRIYSATNFLVTATSK